MFSAPSQSSSSFKKAFKLKSASVLELFFKIILKHFITCYLLIWTPLGGRARYIFLKIIVTNKVQCLQPKCDSSLGTQIPNNSPQSNFALAKLCTELQNSVLCNGFIINSDYSGSALHNMLFLFIYFIQLVMLFNQRFNKYNPYEVSNLKTFKQGLRQASIRVQILEQVQLLCIPSKVC